MENPFIRYWLWYYDVLWRYWPIVVLLTIIAMYLIYRCHIKQQREWNNLRARLRKMTEDTKKRVYENDMVSVGPSTVGGIDHFEYDCTNFHVVIEGGKLTFTDKESGEVFEKLMGKEIISKSQPHR